MIQINSLASSSQGNCHLVTDGKTSLLLDAGLSIKDIRQRLDFGLSDISAALVTHEHMDHSKAVDDLIKAGIDCYMLDETAEIIEASGHRVNIIEPEKQFNIGTWAIKAFPLVHDVPNLGFLMANQAGDKLVYLTDTMYSPYKFQGLTHIMIEANYALDILNANVSKGSVPVEMKRRLLKTHLSIDNAKDFLRANDLSRVQEIHLIHLSDGNSDEARFKREIQWLTGKPVYVAQS